MGLSRNGSRSRITLLLALAGTLACAGYTPAPSRIAGSGWQQTFTLAGTTGPVVVFESGLGDGLDSWSEVVGPVSAFGRAFAYDRAGYGSSRSEHPTRDAAAIVAELRRALQALELAPPYVLVGHSLGGQYVEQFARTHPDEILGVVLVDVRNVDYSRRCVEEGLERCDLSWLTRLLAPDILVREADDSRRGETEIPQAGPFPKVPVRVLSATQRPLTSDELKRVWAETQAELVELSPHARQEICDTCGHYIQRDDPQRVVAAIRDVIEEAGTR